MKNKIKSREETKEVTKITYYICCPECNKEIRGTNTSQVEYNLKLHLDKHKKGENNDKN